MEGDLHGAQRARECQPRIWPSPVRAEPSCSMAENDDNFRQEAGDESRYRVDTGALGVRERKTRLYREEPFRAGRGEKVSRRAMFAREWHLHVTSGSRR